MRSSTKIWHKISFCFCLFFLGILVFSIIGCWNRDSSGNNPVAPNYCENLSSPLLTVSNLRVSFITPEGNRTSASIVPINEQLNAPSVIFKMTLINVGQPSTPVVEIRKVVSVSESGEANATFSNIPALPMVMTIEFQNCSKGGYKSYRGGVDLVANKVNTVEVAPVDSLMVQDITGKLMLELAFRADAFEKISLNLANRVQTVMSGLDFRDAGSIETAITKFNNYSQIADNAVTEIDQTAIVQDPNTGAEVLGNEILITFKDTPTLQDLQLAQANVGGTLTGSYPEIRTYRFLLNDSSPSNAIVGTVSNLQREASENQLNYNVSPHVIVKNTSFPNDPHYTNNWGLAKVGAPESWPTLPSQGVGVAVLDTGIYSGHEDLYENIDFVNSKNFTSVEISNFEDFNGHGTHVSGIIAAAINNSKGTVGVAPNAKIVALKVLGDNGRGSSVNISLAIKYAADLNHVRVINMSLGGLGQIPRDMATAIDYAISKDKVVVVAAGNDNDDVSFHFPGNYSKCFTVGATANDDSRAFFSNYGDLVDISAPGLSIYAPVAGGASNYLELSGTSMATPFVSGLTAAIFSLRPEMTATDAQQLIISSADSISTDQPIGSRINMKNALENLPVPPVNSPVLSLSGPESLSGGAIADFVAAATDPQASILTFEWTISSGSFVVKETQNFKSIIAWNAPETGGWYEVTCRAKNSNGGETQKSVAVYVAPSDSTPPTIISVVPVENSVDIATAAQIVVNFSETIDMSTINSTTFSVASGSNTISGNVTISSDKKTATFTPIEPLPYSISVSVTITTGVKDLAGNPLSANKTWLFTTVEPPDTTPPTIISVVPVENSVEIATAAQIVVNFSETIDMSTINSTTFSVASGSNTIFGNVTISSDKKTATFTPTKPLAYGSVINVIISAGIKDISGNNMASPKIWSFSVFQGVPVTGITLNKASTYIGAGAEETLLAIVSPVDATNKTVTWQSSNENVAIVDSFGKVSGISAGNATVTATAGAKSTTCVIIVIVPVSSVSLNKSTTLITIGSNETLYANVLPNNATDNSVQWQSSNSLIASVDANGKVAGIDEGIATITAIAEGKVAHCRIIVTAPSEAGIVMKSLPGGIFQRDAIPTNMSTVSAFMISRTEITRQQYLNVMGIDPSDFAGSTGMSDPVQMVTWFDAIEFCNKLSEVDSLPLFYSITDRTPATGYPITAAIVTVPDWDANGYRLPTEMEWMWASMGADSDNPGFPNQTGYLKPFPGGYGSNLIGDYAWYYDNSSTKTHPVGTKFPNELFLYDMGGSIEEWCWDWFYNYPTGSNIDYRGANTGVARVSRGGGWLSSDYALAIAHRTAYNPNKQGSNHGFRIVRNGL